jgi:hypothetical protein
MPSRSAKLWMQVPSDSTCSILENRMLGGFHYRGVRESQGEVITNDIRQVALYSRAWYFRQMLEPAQTTRSTVNRTEQVA